MSPSTHSADVSQIQTDTTAILVDTGTTIPAQVSGLRDNAVGFASGTLSISNSSNSSWADSGMTITVPSVAGKTYTVVTYTPELQIDDIGNRLNIRYSGNTLGDSNSSSVGPATVASDSKSMRQMVWGGFVPGETVKIQWITNTNTEVIRLDGTWSMMAYEEA